MSIVDQCESFNIAGIRCRLGSGHHAIGMPHDYPADDEHRGFIGKQSSERVTELEQQLAGAGAGLVAVTAERDRLRAELDAVAAVVQATGSASAFFVAAWRDTNKLVAKLRVEIAKRDRRIYEVAAQVVARKDPDGPLDQYDQGWNDALTIAQKLIEAQR
jgi:hypothetical protein